MRLQFPKHKNHRTRSESGRKLRKFWCIASQEIRMFARWTVARGRFSSYALINKNFDLNHKKIIELKFWNFNCGLCEKLQLEIIHRFWNSSQTKGIGGGGSSFGINTPFFCMGAKEYKRRWEIALLLLILVLIYIDICKRIGGQSWPVNFDRCHFGRCNFDRWQHSLVQLWSVPTLTGSILTDATLTGATLTGATLTGATLTGETLIGINFDRCHFDWCNFGRCQPWSVPLWTVLLWPVPNLTDATLTSATLTDAALTRVILSSAALAGTAVERICYYRFR